jgi:hypothetical protein
MALKKCSDCGNPVSEFAERCSFCGSTMPGSILLLKSCGCLLLICLIGFLLLAGYNWLTTKSNESSDSTTSLTRENDSTPARNKPRKQPGMNVSLATITGEIEAVRNTTKLVSSSLNGLAARWEFRLEGDGASGFIDGPEDNITGVMLWFPITKEGNRDELRQNLITTAQIIHVTTRQSSVNEISQWLLRTTRPKGEKVFGDCRVSWHSMGANDGVLRTYEIEHKDAGD